MRSLAPATFTCAKLTVLPSVHLHLNLLVGIRSYQALRPASAKSIHTTSKRRNSVNPICLISASGRGGMGDQSTTVSPTVVAGIARLGASLLCIALADQEATSKSSFEHPKEEPSEEKGIFISPVSVYYALALGLNGAGPSSSSHSQLLSCLLGTPPDSFTNNAATSASSLTEAGINDELGKLMQALHASASSGGPGQELVVANSVWTRSVTLKEGYVENVRAALQATAGSAPTPSPINAWVAQATRGLIQSLVPQGLPYDAVLANALYFKGLWDKQFDKSQTRPQAFSTASGATVEVPFMTATFEKAKALQVLVTPQLQAALLPYRGGQLAALAVLPAPGADMQGVVREVMQEPDKLQFQQHPKTTIVMPKFKVESSSSLADRIKACGVTSVFDPHEADLSRLATERTFVSEVLHKVVVDVDEEGTEAAAATAVMISRTCFLVPPEELRLVFDRPFVFAVLHVPSRTPLFVGVVQDPSQ